MFHNLRQSMFEQDDPVTGSNRLITAFKKFTYKSGSRRAAISNLLLLVIF